MNDFLKGTFGCLLQGMLMVLGLVFIALSFGSCAGHQTVVGGIFLILGILCWCAVIGIRYSLGHIIRRR